MNVSLLAAVASLLVGAAASLWLGDAAHQSAAAAARASGVAGVGAMVGTIVAFSVAAHGGMSQIALLGPFGVPLIGIGAGLISLGLTVLGGTLAWLAVGEPREQVEHDLWPSHS
jgi:hypothetical protein